MSGIRQSENFIWSVSDHIGSGATGNVYKCRTKQNGQLYAAKVFNHQADRRPYDVRMREIEVLQKLSHSNIVKLICMELELDSKVTVLIMELCQTSLHEILDQPENIYGLDEQDFKDVIRDVSAGMEYLRSENVVHRDVKPGNILRAEQANGKYSYKITDFGAARELGETDQFISVYGTEEYLHPDIYAKAVMRLSNGTVFTSTVDLWSLGVTFYHLATGELPFRPFGGRQNKDTMFKMITEKEPGVISAYQNPMNSKIIYVSKLPENTRIPQCLKTLITPTLKGLLETNPKYMISHDRFFTNIQTVIDMRVFDVFSTKTSSMHRIYLKQEDNFANLQDVLASQTGIAAIEQEIFYNFKEFKPDPMSPVLHYPEITPENPLILVTKEFVISEQLQTKKLTSLPPFSDRAQIDDHVNIAKVHANFAFSLKRQAESLLISRDAIFITHNTIESAMERWIEYCNEFLQNISQHVDNKYSHIISNKTILCKIRIANKQTNDAIVPTESDQERYTAVMDCASKLKEQLQCSSWLKETWMELDAGLKTQPWIESLSADARIIKEIYMKFHSDKYRRHRPTILDDLVQKAERDRLSKCYQHMLDNLLSVTEYRNKLHDQLSEWLRRVQQKRDDLDCSKTALTSEYEEFQSYYEKQLKSFETDFEGCLSFTPSSVDYNRMEKELHALDTSIPELHHLINDQTEQLKILQLLDKELTNSTQT